MAHQEQVWLVTGTSRGIGRAVTERALQAGHKVVATARNTAKIEDFAQHYPNQARVIGHDVNKADHNKQVVEFAVEQFGRVDVLVNNAGYGLEGVVEELTMEQIRHQMETNFFGLVDVTKHSLPYMRKHQHGYIFNISSVAGLTGAGGLTIYNASKFAVNGLSEGLRQEVEEHGIQVSCVEPGPYRTDWAGDSMIMSDTIAQHDPNSPYKNVNERINGFLSQANGQQPGDPYQIAAVLVDAVNYSELPMHLLFGDEAIDIFGKKLDKYHSEDYMARIPHKQLTLKGEAEKAAQG